MAERDSQPTDQKLSPDKQAQWEAARQDVADELPNLIRRSQLSADAAKEQTLSGELRRAIHRSDRSVNRVARDAGITPLMLDEFLTGERTLTSDVLDRLVRSLGYELKPIESS